MLIKTILNRVQKFKCFVYRNARLLEKTGVPELEIELKERENTKAICSGCGKKRRGYDRQPKRR